MQIAHDFHISKGSLLLSKGHNSVVLLRVVKSVGPGPGLLLVNYEKKEASLKAQRTANSGKN